MKKEIEYSLPLYDTTFIGGYENKDRLVDSVYMDCVYAMGFQYKALGKILTLIETLGLPEKQEKSTKNMVKDIYYRHAHDSENQLMKIVFGLEEALDQKSKDGRMTLGSAIGSMSLPDSE